MSQERYTRVGHLLTVLERLTAAREMTYLASVSCKFHNLRPQIVGLPYGQGVLDIMADLDRLIQAMREDVDRECEYAVEELQEEAGIDLDAATGLDPDSAA